MMRDLRVGSSIIDVSNQQATITISLDQSSDLTSNWTENVMSAPMTIDTEDSEVQFYQLWIGRSTFIRIRWVIFYNRSDSGTALSISSGSSTARSSLSEVEESDSSISTNYTQITSANTNHLPTSNDCHRLPHARSPLFHFFRMFEC